MAHTDQGLTTPHLEHAALLEFRSLRPAHHRQVRASRVGQSGPMPKLPQPIIEVAWRQAGEENKIHYRARRPDGFPRRLLARQGDGLYDLLEQHLAAIGYAGPQSAEAAVEEH